MKTRKPAIAGSLKKKEKLAVNAKNMQKYGTNVPRRRISYFHEAVYHAAADLPWKDSWIPMDT
jgi:hypothetical protein